MLYLYDRNGKPRMSSYHTPVLLDESVDLLNINPAGTYVDLTFGGGGHSRAILSKLSGRGRLFAFDQDADAKANIPQGDKRFTLLHSNFRFMRGWLRTHGAGEVDGVLADLGVSSHHFDTGERGFSFRFDGPLDMRMNPSAKVSAADIVNGYQVDELTRIFGQWSELTTPYKVANCVERARRQAPLTTIGQLVEAVKPCTPAREETKFLSKLFQGLRIEVNREMEALEMALEQSLKVLKPGGRLVVISYHSLEDRMVKNFMRSGNFTGEDTRDFYGRSVSPFTVVTRKAVSPGEEEVERNPRARSARLRAAEKL